MFFGSEILNLKPIDVSKITQWALNQSNDKWSEVVFRQRAFATHVHTESIFLMYNENGLRITDVNFITRFTAELSSIAHNVSEVTKSANMQLKRMIIVNLKKYGFIRRHIDSGTFLENHWRCHFPLVTNPNVLFHVGDSTINMLENHGYIINNQVPHGVSNNSKHDRYHLIMDFGHV